LSEQAGKTGALYYSSATLRDTTISFNETNDRILDSKSRIVTAGFENGDKIVVAGASNGDNNGTFTVSSIDAAYLGVTGSLVTETAGRIITVITAPDDAQLLGFFNWSFDQKVDVEEITDFDDMTGGSTPEKKYMALVKDWTATAESYWLTNAQYVSFIGTQKWVRFFIKWVTIPSAPAPAYYYEGMCKVTGISGSEPIGSVVKQTVNFQGDGTLTLVTRITAWDV